jgi:hypothetical protein
MNAVFLYTDISIYVKEFIPLNMILLKADY